MTVCLNAWRLGDLICLEHHHRGVNQTRKQQSFVLLYMQSSYIYTRIGAYVHTYGPLGLASCHAVSSNTIIAYYTWYGNRQHEHCSDMCTETHIINHQATLYAFAARRICLLSHVQTISVEPFWSDARIRSRRSARARACCCSIVERRKTHGAKTEPL